LVDVVEVQLSLIAKSISVQLVVPSSVVVVLIIIWLLLVVLLLLVQHLVELGHLPRIGIILFIKWLLAVVERLRFVRFAFVEHFNTN